MSEKPNLDNPKLDPIAIASQAAALALHLQRSGVQWLPQPRAEVVESLHDRFASTFAASTPAPSARPANEPTVDLPKPIATHSSGPVGSHTPIEQTYPSSALPQDQRQAALDLINDQVQQCERCEVLASCRNKTVFGEGSSSPRFVFFGEGPGADEDQTGRPFVGRAGQLLTKMIEACTLRREDVYILNTVKCRPPGNRNPEPEEIDNCREYYQRQLEILRPEYIVCLGAVSSQELLQNKLSIGKMRGRLHQYFESKVLVTYHPAYLLRTPAAKKAAWDDLQLMMRDAGIQIR